MGLGVTQCRLSNQKLITKSSTKVELVRARDYFQYIIRWVMIMHHQEYLNKSNKFSKTAKAR